MRKLVLVILVALIGVLPVAGSAQTQPAQPAQSATAPAPAQTAGLRDDTMRVLSIGLGAVTGMVVLSVVSTNMISGAALANLGQGALVFIGTVVGGLVGNTLYARENR
ncbi:MAG: hypothetical protein WCF85_14015 [Rhodospirillaceae bacterium]